jgi:hypothetical protein
MSLDRRTWLVLSLSFLVAAAGCRGGIAALSSQGVPALTGGTGASVGGGPAAYGVDFGEVAIGDERRATLSLANTGAAPLRITSVSAPSDPEFTFDLPSGADVGQGESLPVPCAFKPFGRGPKTATLVVGTDSQLVPAITLDLQGVGVQAKLLGRPTTLAFGTVVIHSKRTKAITLTNASDLAITVARSEPMGSGATLFVAADRASSFTLAAGQSVAIGFVYEPLVPSSLDTASVVFTADIGAPLVAALQGVAVESGLVVGPDPLDFNFVQPGQVAALTLRVENVGNLDVNVSQVEVTDSGGGVFQIVPGAVTRATPLAPGVELDVPVQFSPASIQPFEGQITLTSDDNLAPHRAIGLRGWGGGAAIQCAPLALDFGPVAAGIGVSLPVLCSNTGTDVPGHPEAALMIGRLSTASAVFSAWVDASSTSVLSAGQTAVVDVAYVPSGAGYDRAALAVLSNVTGLAPPVIQLSGQGVAVGACSYSVVPAQLDWGDVPSAGDGLRYTEAFTISNVGPNPCVVDAVRLLDSNDGAFTLPGGTLGGQLLAAPGQLTPTVDGGVLPTSLTVPVSFAAVEGSGSYAGQVSFTISDPRAPNQIVNLAATVSESCFSLQPNRVDLGAAGVTGTGQFCQKNRKQFVGVNDCAGDVTVSAVNLGGDMPFELTTPPLPLTIPAGSISAPFVVGFAPGAAGQSYGTVKVQTDLLATPFGLTLHGEAVAVTEQADVFPGNSTPAVDVLWVVDSDDLVLELDPKYAPPDALDRISEVANAARGMVDFQMAVVTNDCPRMDNGSFEPCPTCYNSGSSAFYLTPSSPDPGRTLEDLISQIAKGAGSFLGGVCGGYYNGTLLAAWNALQPNLLSGHNAGFLRDGAALAVIVYDPDAADEDDGSPQSTDYYLNYFSSLKGGDSQLVSVSVMYLGENPPFSSPRYQTLVAASGGATIDSTGSNWTGEISNLWANLSVGTAGYPLSGTPVPDTLQVWLDGPPAGAGVTAPGLPIPEMSSTGTWNWKYVPAFNSIAFNRQKLALSAADTVTVVYALTCE